MFYSIDRFEEQVAVCIGDEDEVLFLSVDQIIGSYSEGSILKERDDGYFEVDEEEENKRRTENFNLAESLFDE